jgi:hypothetical protein
LLLLIESWRRAERKILAAHSQTRIWSQTRFQSIRFGDRYALFGRDDQRVMLTRAFNRFWERQPARLRSLRQRRADR